MSMFLAVKFLQFNEIIKIEREDWLGFFCLVVILLEFCEFN